MIYLILSAEIEIIDKEKGEFKYSPLLKIGYTKNIDFRFDTYLLHNPGCKLLGTREGSTELESYFHSYYSRYKYPERNREWFYYNQEIVDNFQSLQIGDKFLSKEEYIEGLREYIKSNISTPQELKEKYLEDILVEIENTESEIEFDKEFHRSYTMKIWEERYKEEMNFLDSLDFLDLIKDFPENINLRENPWKNQATFYYRTTADYKKMSIDDLKNIINSKRKKTEELISIYKKGSEEEKLTLAETYKNMARLMNYKDNYVAVNNSNSYLKPVFNNLVMVNEIRAFNIQQIDYENRFAVFSTIHNRLTKDDVINREVDQFLNIFKQQVTFFRKMQLLCESGLSNDAINIILDQLGEDSSIKSYYLTLGPQRLRALSYNKTFIEKELGIIMFSQELLYDSIYSEFKEGNKLPLTLIKLRLENIYSSISYQSTPKATDICNYFEVKECLIPVEIEGKKKRVRGYELLKSKEQDLRQELKHAE